MRAGQPSNLAVNQHSGGLHCVEGAGSARKLQGSFRLRGVGGHVGCAAASDYGAVY